jgi:precorrin-6Y C5,15-methyltransferase (decarboxylating)
MIRKIHDVMQEGCVIVFNSVSDASKSMFADAVESVGMRIVQTTAMTIDSFNTINVIKAE